MTAPRKQTEIVETVVGHIGAADEIDRAGLVIGRLHFRKVLEAAKNHPEQANTDALATKAVGKIVQTAASVGDFDAAGVTTEQLSEATAFVAEQLETRLKQHRTCAATSPARQEASR